MADDEQPRTIHPRLEPEIREKLDAYCARNRRSITGAVNTLLEQALMADQATWEYADGRSAFHLTPPERPDLPGGGEFANYDDETEGNQA